MQRLIAHKRWIIGAAIVLAIAVLVWFLAPFVPFGEGHPFDAAALRWIVIFLVILAWLGIEGARAWRVRRKSERLLGELAKDDAAAAETQESEKLRQRFAQAMALLRGTRIGNASGPAVLYALPWYMFIGAPGSGKTTALLKSGLRFPLAPPGETAAALKGIGGTRNCDWWFTDEAVLIDTAGRYTTQDSRAAVDEAGWKTFLALLRRFRPRQPINGIFVTLSVEDLLADDAAQRAAYAQAVRQRVEELQRGLGLEFPIYVLVTKVDLVSGFNEFFSNFDAEQRAQAWGMTFAFDLKTRVGEPARAGFDKEFPALVTKLGDLLFQRLQEERDPERRAVMYPFPQQFAALGPLVSEFLERAFGESRLLGKAIVRGVYFTSGTQEGAPIDRLLSSLKRSLNLTGGHERLAMNLGASKAFFITRLLKEVVFPEAALAGFSERRETALRRLGWGLAAGALLLSAGFVSATTWSWMRNRDALASAKAVSGVARQAVQAVGPPSADDLPQAFAALGAMRLVPAAVHDPVDRPPWSMRYGLYQGDEVQERVDATYRDALRHGLLPRVALHLERLMTSPQAPPEATYAALKSYLMLYEPKHMDAGRFSEGVAASLETALQPEALPAAQAHLAALAGLPGLEAASFHARNGAAEAAARARVAQLSVVDRAYALLRGTPATGVPEVRLSGIVGPSGLGVLERAGGSLTDPVPPIFTHDGYHQLVRGRVRDVVADFAREEDWVMGEKSSGIGRMRTDPTVAEVQRRYFADYASTWDRILSEVRVRRPADMKDALATAQILSLPDSPLRRLVEALDRQTRLSRPDAAASAVGALASQAQLAAPGLAAQGIALAAAAGTDAATRAQEADLDQHFASLRRLAGNGRTSEMDAASQTLAKVLDDLIALQAKKSSGAGVREMPPGLAKARVEAERFGPPVRGALLTLVEFGEKEGLGGVKEETKSGVAGAAATCVRSIPGNYPFARSSAQDLGIQDFVTVFKAGGELDAWFTSNLQPFVDKGQGPWKLKATGDAAPQVSAATLRQFQNAEAIRIAFLGGGAAPSVVADIGVVSGDGEVTLDYDGVAGRMRAGGPGLRVAWPARPGARLSAGGQVLAAAEGPWALFRLVDKGVPEGGSGGDKLRVSYGAPGASRIVLEIRAASSAFNPFRLREIQAFACPRE